MNTRENTYLMLRKKKVAHTWVNRRKQSSDNSLPPFYYSVGSPGEQGKCIYSMMLNNINHQLLHVCWYVIGPFLHCIFLTCIHLRFLFCLLRDLGLSPFCQWIKDGFPPHLSKKRKTRSMMTRSLCFSRREKEIPSRFFPQIILVFRQEIRGYNILS